MTYRVTVFRTVVRATGEILTLEINALSKMGALKKAKSIAQRDEDRELPWRYEDDLYLEPETESIDVLEFEEIEEAES
jgi:hypothetical protein